MFCPEGEVFLAKEDLARREGSLSGGEETRCDEKTIGTCTWREKGMRRYGQDKNMTMAVCNKCGRTLRVEGGYLREFCFEGKAVFGYFSKKDGTSEHFDLCEDCYESLTAQFLVPVEEAQETELV